MNQLRRRLLGAAFTATMSAAVSPLSSGGASQAPSSKTPRLIDVHCHIAPPKWRAELIARGLTGPTTVSQELFTQWSPSKQLEDMEAAGVARTINSVTMPGVWFGEPSAARRLARECNEYAARLKSDHPGRMGFFMVLPMPDVEGSLQEIEYGFRELAADGVHLFTSYEDVWLGEPRFDPLFEELNRRHALVHVHPTVAACCRNLVPGVGVAVIELGTDTARALARFVFSGSSQRYPNLRMIFSHAGGTMPSLIERFEMAAMQSSADRAALRRGFRPEAQRFYYDSAQAANLGAMASLKALIPSTNILFGTDYPVRRYSENFEALRRTGLFDEDQLAGIYSRNALALIERI